MKTPAKLPLLEIFIDRRMPIQRLLSARLRDLIVYSRLGRGTRLPSSRTLARRLAVSRNTVIFAYEELASEGLVTSRPGSGTRIAARACAVRLHDPDGLTIHCAGLL